MAGSTSGWKVVDSPFLAVKLFFFNNLAWVPDEPLRAFVRLPGLLERPMPRNLTRRLRMRQSRQIGCRCKVRMSGLCKVEMSAFMGGRGAYGNGADRLEP